MSPYPLTIALPTYNRAGILKVTLQRLLSDPCFDSSRIEVLVCDNASTDHTEQMVKQFEQVTYHRNETNIGFANFTVAMSLASGRYIKILNDTARLMPGALSSMLQQIEATDSSTTNLYFANPLITIKQGEAIVGNASQFLDKMSYYITWIANFGMWRDDFLKIKEPNRFVETLMQHVDWALIAADNGKSMKVIVDQYVEIENVKNKGRYNIFDTFLNKYFSILRAHDIEYIAYKKEKYRMLRYFVFDWYFTLKLDKEYLFDTKASASIIFKHYWCEPYFYPIMLLGYVRYWGNKFQR